MSTTRYGSQVNDYIKAGPGQLFTFEDLEKVKAERLQEARFGSQIRLGQEGMPYSVDDFLADYSLEISSNIMDEEAAYGMGGFEAVLGTIADEEVGIPGFTLSPTFEGDTEEQAITELRSWIGENMEQLTQVLQSEDPNALRMWSSKVK